MTSTAQASATRLGHKKTELEARVDDFIDQLVAQDVNSPEFGKRVDAITAMGQKEIRFFLRSQVK